MSEVIIGRKAEQEILRQRIESKSQELIAIYGRRRIGKTYLVRQYSMTLSVSILLVFIKEQRKSSLESLLDN